MRLLLLASGVLLAMLLDHPVSATSGDGSERAAGEPAQARAQALSETRRYDQRPEQAPAVSPSQGQPPNLIITEVNDPTSVPAAQPAGHVTRMGSFGSTLAWLNPPDSIREQLAREAVSNALVVWPPGTVELPRFSPD